MWSRPPSLRPTRNRADKGFSSAAWERGWLEEHGALVAATLRESANRSWTEQACL